MNSTLYECDVMHHRLLPKEHRFSYRIFMFYLDLDELDGMRIPIFSHNRPNLFTFNDADHLPHYAGPLKQKLVSYLAANSIVFPANGRVMLLTLPRVLGYIFNPVSFYFCFDSDGSPACAVVEVGNTFGEKKLYVVRESSAPDRFRLITPKHFYVSPFSDLDLSFDFKLRIPCEALEIHIDDVRDNHKTLLSALTGQRSELTAFRLGWFAIKYPLLTLKVIFLIHWNAFLLWLKGVPFHAKEANPGLQRDVIPRHATITGNAP